MLLLAEVILSLFLISLTARINEKNWVSPGAFFALLWSSYALAALLFDLESEILVQGLLWVILACVIMHLACFCGQTRETVISKVAVIGQKAQECPLPYIKSITCLLTLVGIGEIAFLLFDPRSTLVQILSFAYINEVSVSNRAAFGYGEEMQGPIERAAFVLIYTAPLFGGILFGSVSSLRAKILGFCPLLTTSFVGMLYGSRMGVLYGGSFWIAAYMASQVFGDSIGPKTGGVFLTKVLMANAVCIIGMSALAILVRYEEENLGSLEVFLERTGDIFSFLPAFAIWFQSDGLTFSDLTFGHRTFGRIFELTGLRVADKYYYLPIDVGFTSSNIFTIFRGLIEDFGSIGALICVFFFGCLSGISYRQVMNKKASFMPLLTAVYAGILTSFSFSLFTYVTPTLALGLFWAYFSLVGRKYATMVNSPALNSSG